MEFIIIILFFSYCFGFFIKEIYFKKPNELNLIDINLENFEFKIKNNYMENVKTRHDDRPLNDMFFRKKIKIKGHISCDAKLV